MPASNSQIFISYAREDSEFALKLATDLRREGANLWLDTLDIKAGRRWDRAVQEALTACPCMLVILSPAAVSSDNVLDEVHYALEEGKEIIPVLHKTCEIPYRLRRLQRIDVQQGISHLLQVLRVARQRDSRRAQPNGPRSSRVAQAAVVTPKKRIRLRPSTSNRPAAPKNAAPSQSSVKVSRAALRPGSVKLNTKDGLEYIWIPPGKFMMGATREDDKAEEDEKPSHLVQISSGFWLGKTPVTVGAYKRFATETGREMPAAPAFNAGWRREAHPVVTVTWNEAKAYCSWAGGRLPNEAEWEHAARAGKRGWKYPWGNEISPSRARYGSNAGTTPVDKFMPQNAWGLHDMAGNVFEWMADWYDQSFYSSALQYSATRDPKGPRKRDKKVLRGGSWGSLGAALRTANRAGFPPETRNFYFGFRCLMNKMA